jgi:hypothetical protein
VGGAPGRLGGRILAGSEQSLRQLSAPSSFMDDRAIRPTRKQRHVEFACEGEDARLAGTNPLATVVDESIARKVVRVSASADPALRLQDKNVMPPSRKQPRRIEA